MADTLSLYLLAKASAWPPVAGLTSVNTFTAGNVTTLQAISDPWAIPAGDPAVGTTYEIETTASGTWEAESLTLGVNVDSAASAVQHLTIGASILSAAVGFNLRFGCRVQCTAIGASGSLLISSYGEFAGNVVLTASNTVSLAGGSATQAVNTAVSHTITLTAQWGAAATGQTMTASGAVFRRYSRS
jgi:hypothetical protein